MSSNTATLVPFNTEDWDTDSAYTNTASNYKFTVPSGKAGKYRFYSQIGIGGFGATCANVYMFLYKNGTETYRDHAQTTGSYINGGWHLTMDVILNLSVGDYIQIYAKADNASAVREPDTGIRSFFGGHKIIE